MVIVMRLLCVSSEVVWRLLFVYETSFIFEVG